MDAIIKERGRNELSTFLGAQVNFIAMKLNGECKDLGDVMRQWTQIIKKEKKKIGHLPF